MWLRPLGVKFSSRSRRPGCVTPIFCLRRTTITPFPAVFGHEVSGVVAQIGPDVTQFRLGDHVVGSLIQSCGSCARCQSGRSFQCLHPEATQRRPGDAPRLSRRGAPVFQGMGLGGFAERALIHENQLALVPKDMPFAQAALLGCGVVTGAGAVLNTASVHAGDTVIIFGVGGVGLNAVSSARIACASRIVVIDLQPKRLEVAVQFGATDVSRFHQGRSSRGGSGSATARRRSRVRLRGPQNRRGARARHAERGRRPVSRRCRQARGQS